MKKETFYPEILRGTQILRRISFKLQFKSASRDKSLLHQKNLRKKAYGKEGENGCP